MLSKVCINNLGVYYYFEYLSFGPIKIEIM